jgi:hypothetical protein
MESIEEEVQSNSSMTSNKFGSRSRILRNSSSIKIEDGIRSRPNLDNGRINELSDEKMQALVNLVQESNLKIEQANANIAKAEDHITAAS